MDFTKVIRYAVLVSVLAAAAWFKFAREHVYEPAAGPIDSIAIEPIDPSVYRSPPTPAPDDVHGIGDDLWTAPESGWREREKRTAGAALMRSGPALLILPVEGGENAFDPIERSLITRIISDRIRRSTKYRVANPTAVLRYLGAHRLAYSDDDIATLAKAVSARGVLALRAQHDRHGNWSLTASLHDGAFGAPLKTREWNNLAYEDASPAFEALAPVLDEIVELATDQTGQMRVENTKFRARDLSFPDSVEELVARTQESPLHSAAYLQLLAALHPLGDYNEVRNALFERSLVELQRVSPKASFYRYFKARALARLHRRPAAIAALGEPENDYEQALLEALNGNLPELSEHLANAGNSGMDFLMFKDYQRVKEHYSGDSEEPVDEFAEANPSWAPFIQRSIRDYDGWARFSAATVKLGLELLMPAEVVSLETQFSGQLALGDAPQEHEIVRLVWKHLAEFNEETTKDWLVNADYHAGFSPLDVLELAETITVANHLRAVNVDLKSRGLPDAALRKISELEPVLAGHAEVTLLKAKALQAKSDKSNNEIEAETLRSQAASHYLNGLAWSGSLSINAVAVARDYYEHLQRVGKQPEGYLRGRFAGYSRRYFEWPMARGWLHHFSWEEVAAGNLETCIDYTSVQFDCIRFRIVEESKKADDPSAVRDQVLSQYAHRFNGHPSKVEFEIEYARQSDDPDAEMRLLQEQLDAGSTDWSMYYALGRIHKRRGDYVSAKNTWLAFPDFDTGDGPIAIGAANNAGSAGSMLYWIGQHELAAPLLEISAASRSGSAVSMSASARLALIEGDLATAAEWSAARVRRYQSSYGLRDLLQILHITDQSDAAWQIFDQVQANMQNTQMWSGALVGHHLDGASISDISGWLAANRDRNRAIVNTSRKQSVDLAQRYLLLAGTMDRAPTAEFVEAVAAAPTRARPRYRNSRRRIETEDGPTSANVAAIWYASAEYRHDRHLPTPPNEQHLANGTETDTRYEMLSEAMSAFLNEDYESAYKLFNNTAYFYFLDEYLPYHAFSASIVGEVDHIVTALKKREWKLEELRMKEDFDTSELGYRFDEDLTYAVIAAFEGEHPEALARLRAALNNRPYMDSRTIFPMYQLADIADRLYERTGQDDYKEFALDLSRRHTVVLPMYGWAYFIVAKYSDSQVERRNAAASGLWLDPLSERGEQLSKKLQQEARDLLEASGPPFRRDAGRSTSRGA